MAGKTQTRKRSKSSKSTRGTRQGSLRNASTVTKWIGATIVTIIAFAVVFYSLSYAGLLSPYTAPDVVVTDETSTIITFNVIDPYDSENEVIDDAQVNVFILDTEDWTAGQLEDLDDAMDDYSQYELDSSKDWDDASIDMETYEYYLVIVNLTGYDTVYMASFYSEALGYPQLMSAGLNTVHLVNSTETVAIEAYAVNDGTVAAADTTDREWRVAAICQDTDGDLTNVEGFKTSYDFVNDVEDSFVIKIIFNTTAESDWCDFESIGTVNYETSTTALYIELSLEMFSGHEQYSIEFDSGLNTDFEVVSIAIGHGSAASFTQWDILA